MAGVIDPDGYVKMLPTYVVARGHCIVFAQGKVAHSGPLRDLREVPPDHPGQTGDEVWMNPADLQAFEDWAKAQGHEAMREQ